MSEVRTNSQPRLPPLAGLAFVLFVSGCCSLIYQVVWLRSLRLIFGSSTLAMAVVLAIFMGGLGLGGLYFGRRTERSSNPLALYARLEMAIAATAAVSLLLLGTSRELYLALGGSSSLGAGGATLLRLVLSVLVLGLPTFFMGGTLPAAVQAAERRHDVSRRIVATLYGVNALGAVLGALLTTFVLLESLGVSRALWTACSVNLLLAVWVRTWGRAADGHELFAAVELPGPEGNLSPPAPRSGARLPIRVLLVFAGLTGFLYFMMELVWYRMLTPLLGGSTYTFGLILALALLGIGVGGWWFSLGAAESRPGLDALAVSASLEALALVLPFALGDRLAFLAQALRDLQGGGFVSLVCGWTVIVSLVVLPASLVAGYQFPLLVSLIGQGRDHVGSDVGRAYAWNTWGAVLGSLAGGLVLLPAIGAGVLWQLSIGLLAILGIFLAVLASRRSEPGAQAVLARRWGRFAMGVAAFALLLTAAEGPTAFWRHTATATARSWVAADPNELRSQIHGINRGLVAESEGRESSVALVASGELALVVNGKGDGSSRRDAPTQVLGGLLGAALHPEPRSALVIGLGTGMTAGWLAAVDTMERVDVVELEPSMIELSQYLDAANLNVIQQPNVRIHVGDGREFVRTTKEHYDIVFSEPSNPYRAGVADLFTREIYQAVSQRLTEGGIFLQWLQAYEIDAEAVAVVITTLRTVFPHVECWQTLRSDLVLMASMQPIEHDFDRVRGRVAAPPFRDALGDVLRVEGVEGFYSGYVGDGRLARAIASADVEPNSDDRPVLEFSFARSLGRPDLFSAEELQALSVGLGANRPAGRGTPPEWHRVDEMRRIRRSLGTLAVGGLPPPRPDAQMRDRARLAFAEGDVEGAWYRWQQQPAPPSSSLDRLLVAEGQILTGALEAEQAIDALARQRPAEAALLRARRASTDVDRWRGAIAAVRDDPWVHEGLMQRSLAYLEEHGDAQLASALFDLLAEPFPGYLADHQRKLLRLKLASMSGRFDELCTEALAELEPWVPWSRPILDLRMQCYETTDDPRSTAARRDLHRFDREDSRSLGELVRQGMDR
ncbi:MAG: fused MFS/spermidine synthase [Thermoanaerobaculia bacterium]|nr:fused MFS/spermidine synthase [Thermoanaerobaculia bacterium]